MKSSRGLNLRFRLPVLVYLLFAVQSGLMVADHYRTQEPEEISLASVRQQLAQLRRLIENGADRKGAFDRIEQTLKESASGSQIKTLALLDQAGRIIFSHPPGSAGKLAEGNLPGFETARLLKIQGGQRGEMVLTDGNTGDSRIIAYYPLSSPQSEKAARHESGSLYAVYAIEAPRQQWRAPAFLSGALFWLLSLLVVALVIAILHYLVSRPVRHLISAARRLAEGDYSVRVEREGPGDLVQLADAFNLMVARLNESRQNLLKQKNLYSMLSAANKLIIQIDQQDALFKEICQIAIHYEGFVLAWIGLIDESQRVIEIKASAGNGREYLQNPRLAMSQESALAPVETAIRTLDHVVLNDVFGMSKTMVSHAIAKRIGIRSAAVFPIAKQGRAVGVLTLYANLPDFFNADIVGLLDEMAKDVSFALVNLEREAKRERAELALREREEDLAITLHSIGDAVIAIDGRGLIKRMNPSAEKFTGWSFAEAVGRPLSQVFKRVDAKTQETLPSPTARLAHDGDLTGQVKPMIVIARDGKERRVSENAAPMRNRRGEITGAILVLHDVTEEHLMASLLRGISEVSGAQTGLAFFQSLVRQLAEGMDADYALIATLDDSKMRIATLAVYAEGRLAENFSGTLEDFPCASALGEGDCVYPQGVQKRFPHLKRLAAMSVESHAAVRLRGAAGEPVGLLAVLAAKPMEYAQTKLSLLKIVAIRTSAELQRIKTEEELRLSATAFETHEAIVITDKHGDIVRVNKAFTLITGYSQDEVIGNNLSLLLKSGAYDDEFYQQLWQSLSETKQWQGEISGRRKSGESFPELLTITAVTDREGLLTHYVATFLDITEHKQAEMEIQRLAYYDALTGLPNRRMLMDRLQHELAVASRYRIYGALLFLDLDNFKTINDALGHSVGDALLQQVAERLVDRLRAEDTVARLGGDEFVVVLPGLSDQADTAANQARTVAEKIQKALAKPYYLHGHEHHTSASLGVTLFTHEIAHPDDLLKQADTAMYRSKAAGRNTIRFYLPSMQQAADARLSLENDLRHAIARDELQLHYQPQFDNQAELVGAEVLVRWRHPQWGMISPVEFIPVAEETGLILPLGEWVLLHACSTCKSWLDAGIAASLDHIAVNVSPRQFHQAGFVRQVLSVLSRTGLEPNRLTLELTESIVIENVTDTIEKMRSLREFGIHFSIDDFGTGYSSLSYLKRLPIDQLKIDQSFVRDTPMDPSDQIIVETIIAMAQHMRLNVIAEGVETEDQLRFLSANGCQAYQGYYFSKPLSQEEFTRYLTEKPYPGSLPKSAAAPAR